MMAEDCCTIVRGCPHCRAFEGEVPKAPLCPIRAEQAPSGEERPLDNQPFHKVCPGGSDEGPLTTKTVTKVFYEHFIAVFGVPAKLLSDRDANFTSALVDELCAAFGIQKC